MTLLLSLLSAIGAMLALYLWYKAFIWLEEKTSTSAEFLSITVILVAVLTYGFYYGVYA